MCDKCKDLGQQINGLQDVVAEKNKELDRLHKVWCSGGCENGMHRWAEDLDDVTAEDVKYVKLYAQRLESYYNSKKYKDGR